MSEVSGLELIVGDQVIPFPGDRFFIGSAPECGVRLPATDVRPRHAEVMREADGSWWVRDISGSGSVRVDGNATWESQLVAGSCLTVGRVDCAVREAGSDGSGTVNQRGSVLRARLPTEQEVAAAERRAPDRGAQVTTTPDAPAARPARAKGQLEPGELIDHRYRVVKKLAAGGMGEVFEAEHVDLHKPVALKVMLPDLSRDADFVARFKREAIASSRIGQQNIVDISDFGRTAEGRFYFVMELLDGRTLAQHLKDGPFSQWRAAHVMIQIARALMAAHDRGIVHRDLKPENVMLLQRPGQADFVKVLDFGIAKVNEGHPGASGGLTQIGTVVGTPQYMSPEQAAGLPVDARTDVYSLGLLFYEALAGRPAFTGDSPSTLMSKQMTAVPAPLSSARADLSIAPDLERLVFHLLAKKPGDRPQSMHEVVERLDPYTHGALTGSRQLTSPSVATGSQAVIAPLGPVAELTLARGGTVPDAPAAPPAPAKLSQLEPATRELTTEIAPPPSQVKKIVGLFAVCFVLALILGRIGAAMVLGRQEEQPAPIARVAQPQTTSVPEKVPLTIDTRPTGAKVYQGDALLGTTPVTLSRARQQVMTLRFELDGFKPLVHQVRFAEDERLVTVELERR